MNSNIICKKCKKEIPFLAPFVTLKHCEDKKDSLLISFDSKITLCEDYYKRHKHKYNTREAAKN